MNNMNCTKERKRKWKKRIKAVLCLVMIFSMVLTGCSGDATSDGEKELQKEECGFIVLNQNGEVLSGAVVDFGGNTGTTGSDGTVSFTKPEEETVSLSVSCLDYYDYSQPSFQVGGNIYTITLYARTIENHRLKTAVYKNTDAPLNSSVDLLTEYKKVNMSTSNLDFDIETAVLGDADTVTRYELHQISEGYDNIIQTSTDGYFRGIKVKDFQVGTSIFVSVYDNNNHQTSTALNLEIGENPNVTEHSEFSFGDEWTFAVKDDIPIFGGTTFNFGFPSIPLNYSYSEDKVMIGFNVSKDILGDDDEMDDYKKMVSELIRTKNTLKDPQTLIQKLKTRQQRKGLMRLSGFDAGVDVCVGGYAEAGFDSNGQLSTGEGCVFVTVTAEADWGWQVIVGVVPVVIDIEGNIEANLAASLAYSFNENKFSGDVSLTIAPELKAKAGVGFEYLSAGVYGSAGLETKLIIADSEEEPGFQYLDLTSSIGIYSKIAFLEPEKDLAKGTFNLWTRKPKEEETTTDEVAGEAVDSVNVYSSELYDTANYYPIVEADSPTARIMSADGYDVLTGNISSGATPVTVSDEDTALTMFTAQTQLGEAQSTYSKLYYSYYEDGCWTNSAMMDEEVKNQMNPQLYCNDGEYYLLYQEADFDNVLLDDYKEKTEEERKALLQQVFLSYDLHVKKFDKETNTFIDLGCIETVDAYDYNADMIFAEGVPYVYSVSNNTGDFFGTDEHTRNQILSSCYKDGQWNTTVVQNDLNSVTRLSAGIYGGQMACLYSVDGDNDLLSAEDVSTYIYDGTVTKLMDNGVSQIVYDSLPGNAEKTFLIADETGLSVLDGNYSLRCVLENQSSYYGKYAISEHAIYDVQKTKAGTEVFAFYPLEDGRYSGAVQITSEDKWQKDVSAVTMEGKDRIIGLSEEYDVSDISTELVAYEVDSYYDLCIDTVYMNYKDLLNQAEVPVEVTLSNTGNVAITAESICVKDAEDNVLPIVEKDYSTELVPGASHTYTIHVQTNEETAYGTWTIETAVSCDAVEMEEKNKNNNSYEYITGHSDFVLSTKVNNSGAYPYLLVEVKNEGNVRDSADLVLYDANDTSNILKSYGISSLDAGNSKVYKIKLLEEWADENGKLALLAKVVDSECEMYLYNNYEYEYATMNYGTYNIVYELNGGVNSEKNPSTYTTTDDIALENPAKDGYTFAGWYTTSTFDTITKVTELEPGGAGNLTLYAKWTSALKGDGNGDNEVTLADAQIALKAALKIMDVSTVAQISLDIDGNGIIELSDAQAVLKAALKIITLE